MIAVGENSSTTQIKISWQFHCELLRLHSEKRLLLTESNAELHEMLFCWNPQKKSSPRMESPSYGQEKKLQKAFAPHPPKNIFLQQKGRTEQSMTLLLKKPSQRLITIPRAHHNINFWVSLSKGFVMHLPSLLLEENKVTLWFSWKKKVALNLWEKKNNHQVSPKSPPYSSCSGYRNIVMHYKS